MNAAAKTARARSLMTDGVTPPVVPVTSPIVNKRAKLPRSGPCPCGSKRKWKLCHLPAANAGATGPIKASE